MPLCAVSTGQAACLMSVEHFYWQPQHKKGSTSQLKMRHGQTPKLLPGKQQGTLAEVWKNRTGEKVKICIF